jgi:hypothetical protein
MSQAYAPSKVAFNFRAISEAAKVKLISQGKPVPAKRENFIAELNYLTLDGILNIMGDESPAGDKMRDLLLDSVNATIFAQAKEFVDSDEGQMVTGTGDMPHDKLSWEAIALMPKESRASTAIPKELWDAFVLDYVAVMPAAAGVTTEQAKAAAATFKNKFSQVKTNKEALGKLLMRLDQWQGSSANSEDFAAIYEVLKNKGTEFLNFDPASQAEAY